MFFGGYQSNLHTPWVAIDDPSTDPRIIIMNYTYGITHSSRHSYAIAIPRPPFQIVHASTGIVPSNPVITTFQVLSRVMVVVGVVMATPTGKVSPGLPLALLAWSVTEIIRYGYYAFNLVGAVPSLLVMLRYTTFIILYPIGVTGELLCFYWAQDYARTEKVWSFEMPNKYNFTFSYLYFLWFVMLLYIPLFPQMYLHMFAQRKKVLSPRPAVSSSQSKLKAK